MAPEGATHVALADQDDVWHPDKLATLLGALGPARLAYCDMRIVSEDGAVRSETFWRGRRNNYTSLASLLLANTVTGAAMLMPRELLDVALPFPPQTPDAFHDQWIAAAALATGQIAYVARPLQDYVQHEAASLGHEAAMRGYHPTRLLRHRTPGAIAAAVAEHGCRAYLMNIPRIAVMAKTLELRAGAQLDRAKLRAVRRLARFGSPREPIGWLAMRSPRPLVGRTETAGIELALLNAVLWRRAAMLRARGQSHRPGRGGREP
jgi:hypothetical protein